MLEVEEIRKSYGKKEILHGISFKVESGTCLGIIGPNGSGKSTLLSIIVGAQKADSGKVSFGGKIGYVPQDNALMEELTVRDNLLFWGTAYNKRTEEIFESKYMKDRLGLGEILNQKVSTLSGGMKKRVNIAIALINDPDYIILDEPCVALDVIYKNEIVAYLNGLKKQGKTIIYTSHSSDELERLCDEICVIKKGSMILKTTLEEMKKKCTDSSFEDMLYGLLS